MTTERESVEGLHMKPKPNIVLITCDQLRPFEIGCYGGEDKNSSNIDQLSLASRVFMTAITPNPCCTPARSCILSGQYSRTCNGTLFNCGEPKPERQNFPDQILPEILKQNGYETSIIGKWHIKTCPGSVGFDEAVIPKVSHLNTNQQYKTKNKSFTVQGYAPNYELSLAREYIERRRDDPFFLYYNISLPHMPYFDVPKEYQHRYEPESVDLRKNSFLSVDNDFNQHWFRVYMYDYLYYTDPDNTQFNKLPDDFGLKDLYAMYKGMIIAADDQVGRIIKMIKEAGKSENTVVVFVSDHGDNMGSHGQFNKDITFEEAIRIPFMICWNGSIEPGIDKQNIVSLIDIAPTLLDLAGIEIPAYMQGLSVKPLLTRISSGKFTRDKVFIECTNGEVAVRTKEHMYSVLTNNNTEERRAVKDDEYRFFDLIKDPYQMNDLAKAGIDENIRNELKQCILDWNQNTKWFEGR
ncbi:MAG: sulfatase-like hydrolase/transferase [Candidatus Delongbacteria bacterium]